MTLARKFEFDFWDGERKYGYGGYHYIPGRLEPVARALIERYDLKNHDSVLDIGCGKGYLLYELQKLLPKLELHGIDRSKYAIKNKHPALDAVLTPAKIQDSKFSGYDLVVSLGTLHNLTLAELSKVLPQIQRGALHAYVMVESFRDEQELWNLQCWCLTAETLIRPEDWLHLFDTYRYTGDYEFIFFK